MTPSFPRGGVSGKPGVVQVGLNAAGANTDAFDFKSDITTTLVLGNTGWARVGAGGAANTTAGDLTTTRLSIGNGTLGTAGELLRGDITDTTTASGSNTIVA